MVIFILLFYWYLSILLPLFDVQDVEINFFNIIYRVSTDSRSAIPNFPVIGFILGIIVNIYHFGKYADKFETENKSKI